MAGVDFLANLPAEKEVQVGVLDIRSMMIETPEQIAGRARKVLEHVDADRVTLATDCGMKPLPRTVARMKLKSLAQGAEIVRGEL
jgi:5-methyltetrahydropteroyltriglutamate--homocysteine methyltransferase